MLGALGVLWTVEEILYRGKAWVTVSQADASEDESGDTHHKKTLAKALESVEIPSLLFFIGILLAVSALQSEGLLTKGAALLNRFCQAKTVVEILGIISALLDNVPLTAAAIKMYQDITADNIFWHMLALCVGTGGSLLVIGSAAGVVIMDKAKITFGWYLKRFTLPVFAGYVASIAMLFLLNR
jgi:Na+/H+ antiporter NhaD/arsenite permease-like protein